MNAMIKSSETLWTDVGAVSDIPRRGSRRVPSAAGDIALFRTGDGAVYALLDRCPHKHGPLSQGIIHGHAVTCPLHAWSIDLRSGEAMGADAGKGCTPTVPLEVRDGRLFLGLSVDG
jgi:nitrite reductase (NADH) small subunit